MSSLLDRLYLGAQQVPRRILFPEIGDPRVLEACQLLAQRELAVPVLLKRPANYLGTMEIFSERSDAGRWRECALKSLLQTNKHRGMTTAIARQALQNSDLLLAAALVSAGFADAGVAGSLATTADVLRAGLRGIGKAQGSTLVSSFFLMLLQNGQVLTYADCSVVPEPDAGELATIAIAAARSHERLTGESPRVALLSFSTNGSASHSSVNKVRQALGIVKAAQPTLCIDGELQFDAAMVPAIACHKAPKSPLRGNANVLVFPNLDAANIAYKMTERLSGATAIGPVLQGLRKPWMDLSRGCKVSDIVDVAVIASLL